ncbi:MAG: hypothetical protein D4S01_02575 [Dehalococcoidia bacterium]|nr:MAG: hypothetical protein D4S01_02575 [Dehalococcoidia bacterium]
MTKLEPGYILTRLGRTHGYVGLLKDSEIDDPVRRVFAILREEDVPVLLTYLQARLPQLSTAGIVGALKKLTHAGLVSEVN